MAYSGLHAVKLVAICGTKLCRLGSLFQCHNFAIIDLVKAEFCECSSVVERDLPKVEAGVRFSSLAPKPI